jgi:nickel-type superoxide dismutase maturation protease
MSPTLKDGDTVIVNLRAYRTSFPAIGDVVFSRHPFKSDVKFVKRIFAPAANNSFDLRGDNNDFLASTDSRSLGNVPAGLIYGQVVAILQD